MRGEYWSGMRWIADCEELPPRARRILLANEFDLRPRGTTSACAENTGRNGRSTHQGRNYLRVRGEYKSTSSLIGRCRELPPRARRILPDTAWTGLRIGTTSACAENTYLHQSHPPQAGNYLRVRGEYWKTATSITSSPELPPRARRILRGYRGGVYVIGTTSACAENTWFRGA